MESQAPCREDLRQNRRWRRDGRLLGAGQISPYHCHPYATEIYFCVSGGGTMRTPTETMPVTPGSFVVHPAGEVHEYENGPGALAVPRPLRLRHAVAPLGLARQYGLETIGRGCRILSAAIRSRDHIFSSRLDCRSIFGLVLVGQRDVLHPFRRRRFHHERPSTANRMWSMPISITQQSSAGLEKKPLVIT